MAPGLTDEQLAIIAEKRAKALALKAEREKYDALAPGAEQEKDLGLAKIAEKRAQALAIKAEKEKQKKRLDGALSPATGRLEEPWVDKYAPKDLRHVLGNEGGINKLAEWLRDWDDVVFRGRSKAVRFRPGGGAPENVNARAALVSGPPGIGKTTACRLVAEAHRGYGLLEYNASDTRGQKIIQEMADGVASSRTLSFGSTAAPLGGATAPALTRRVVIIMDEVDGMGGGDRGGNAALIKMIKKSKNPIICICNDAYSPKVRSLASSCLDIRFTRPSKVTIAQRAAQIAAAETLSVNHTTLEALAESCGNDMRHVLNQLQAMAKSPLQKQLGIEHSEMRDEKTGSATKDGTIMLGPFDACRNLLTSSVVQKLSVQEKLEHFFVDHSLMSLMVQENYLNSVAQKRADPALLQSCARSAELIATGDLFGKRICENQEWGLLPDMGIVGTIYPAHVTNGFVSYPEFPKWLGNYSKVSKARRLSQELHAHLRLFASVPRSGLASSNYVDVLHSKAMRPLLRQEGVDGAVAVLDAYGFQREHLAEHLSELTQHLGKRDEFKLVDSKLKAAMTRELNSGCHAVRVVLPAKRKAGGGGAVAPEGEELGEMEDRDKDRPAPVEEEGAESRSDAEDAGGGSLVRQVKARKTAAGKAKAKPKAQAKSAGEEPAKSAPKAKAKGRAKAAA